MKNEFDRDVCRCCKSCTRLSKCNKVMTFDVFSNGPESLECRFCDSEYTCCSDFTPKLLDGLEHSLSDNKKSDADSIYFDELPF